MSEALRRFDMVIPGEPIAKGRPKLGIVNGHAHAFTPKRTRSYEDIVREHAIREWGARQPLHGHPLTLRAMFVLRIAPSWPKKKQQAARANLCKPIGKPDLSNFIKAIEDGLQGVVYADDSAITETYQAKFYGPEPHVAVTITW